MAQVEESRIHLNCDTVVPISYQYQWSLVTFAVRPSVTRNHNCLAWLNYTQRSRGHHVCHPVVERRVSLSYSTIYLVLVNDTFSSVINLYVCVRGDMLIQNIYLYAIRCSKCMCARRHVHSHNEYIMYHIYTIRCSKPKLQRPVQHS